MGAAIGGVEGGGVGVPEVVVSGKLNPPLSSYDVNRVIV